MAVIINKMLVFLATLYVYEWAMDTQMLFIFNIVWKGSYLYVFMYAYSLLKNEKKEQNMQFFVRV